MVSHPETGSDSPIGSDRDRGRDSSDLFVVGFSQLGELNSSLGGGGGGGRRNLSVH